jgi:hypothetical protein
MVFNTIFNNISVTSWQSVLLVEETGVPGENQTGSVFWSSLCALAYFYMVSKTILLVKKGYVSA